METKICSKCGINKPLSEFFKNGRGSYRCDCKECNKIYMIKYRIENNENIKKKNKEWIKNNKEKHNQQSKKWHNENIIEINKRRALFREKNRERLRKESLKYIKNNKEKHINRSKKYNLYNKNKINDRIKLRLKNNPLFKLKLNIRGLINLSLKRKKFIKSKHTEEILGCTFENFKLYLESKFEPWMNWQNRGLYNGELNYGWDIDHIIPLDSAITEEDIIKLNHYTNLQPLCSKINRDIKRNLIN